MKTLGVIGGLGPMATAYFMRLVIEMTDAETDQEHIPMIIYNWPHIPDRTRYLLGQSPEDPVPAMAECGRRLLAAGAGIAAIPCITAHALHNRIQEEAGLPVLHAIRETAGMLREKGIQNVALEATNGTVETRVFQEELERHGMRVILPSPQGQQDVMDIIYRNIKAGKPADMDKFRRVEEQLLEEGAQVIILGCTELSMIKRDYPLRLCYLDTLEVLARAAVRECAKLRPEYEDLLRYV